MASSYFLELKYKTPNSNRREVSVGKTNSDYPLMFAVLIALAFLGIVLYYVVVALEKIFAGWAERNPG